MRHKDMMILAVLINMGLLTILFATAVSPPLGKKKPAQIVQSEISPQPQSKPQAAVAFSSTQADDIDQIIQNMAKEPQAEATASLAATPPEKQEEQFYLVKSGDNPWTIAKQHGIEVDYFLQLNQLDKKSARQLRVGQKVRIK